MEHSTNFPYRGANLWKPLPTAHNAWLRAKHRLYMNGMKPKDILRFKDANMTWAGSIPLFTLPINKVDPHRNSDEVIYLCAFREMFGVDFRFATSVYMPDRFTYRDTQSKRLGMILTPYAYNLIEAAQYEEEPPEMVSGYPEYNSVVIGSTNIICFVYATDMDNPPCYYGN